MFTFLGPEGQFSWPPIGLLLVVLPLASLLVFRKRLQRRYRNLPPGPPANWWGKSPMPPGRSWLAFEEMQEEYGPIITIKNGPFSPPSIYITRAAPAVELLDKRGATTGDRASNYIASDVLTGGYGLLFARYGEKFRRLRKAVHQQLMPKMAEAYGPLSERAARNMLRDILSDSDNFKDIFHTYAASVVNSMTFAKRNKTHYSDPGLKRALAWNRELVKAVTPGAYKSDTFPFLLYWPGYLDVPRKAYQVQLTDYMQITKAVQDEMAGGEAPPSFVKYLTEQREEYELTQEEIAWLAGGLYHAGSDTTAITINHGLLAAATHPAAQARVKAEIDSAIGSKRTPTFDDQANLPYLAAFIKEVLRWRSVNPTGFPHRMMQDEQLDGYVIPKDSLVFGVHWCLHRDPTLYDDVDSFKPERWLETDKTGRPQLRSDMRHFAWGFGRRNCPGMHIAERSIYINLAHLMWAFDIIEDPASPIETRPDLGFVPAGISGPLPYKVHFKPRRADLDTFLGEEELLIDE